MRMALSTVLLVAVLAVAAVVFVGCPRHAAAYYLPGTVPVAYAVGQPLRVKVNSLSSERTQLPYDYYSLPFCTPEPGTEIERYPENVGEVLMGDVIKTSPYVFRMMKEERDPMKVCTVPPLTEKETSSLNKRIENDYHVNMILDNLPITMNDLNYDEGTVLRGVDVGENVHNTTGGGDSLEAIVYNHLVFNVLVHRVSSPKRKSIYAYDNFPNMVLPTSSSEDGSEEGDDEGDDWYMVVGFEVMPCSVDWNVFEDVKGVKRGEALPSIGHCRDFQHQQYVKEKVAITYSYEVFFELSDTAWVSRWDAYLKMRGAQVHWFSILNSILVIFFFSGIIFLILVKTVRKDLSDEVEVDGAAIKQDIGWKLVCGDVFRAPPNSEGFAIAIGTGIQILGVSLACIFLAMLGFLSPASRGALLSTALMFYLIMSYFSAYAAVRTWTIVTAGNSSFPSTSTSTAVLLTSKWKALSFKTGTYFFAFCFCTVLFINIVLTHTKSTAALPVYMFFVLVLLWAAIVVPLSLAGGYVASMKGTIDFPTRTNQLARQIPKQPVPPIVSMLVSGILPFGTVFIELYFIMSSIWLHEVYYVFGFLFVVFLLTIIVCAEVSIVMTYIQLSHEDYRWWWRSFFGPATVGLYAFVYAVGYFLVYDMHMAGSFRSVALYIGYNLIIAIGLGLMAGTIGFLATFYFIYKIFGMVKLD